jgi:protein ImuA
MPSSPTTVPEIGQTDALRSLISTRCIWRAEPNESPRSETPFSELGPAQRSRTAQEEVIPFRVPEIDEVLPQKGLTRNTVHEIFYRDPLQPLAVACTLSTIIAYNAYISSYTTHTTSLWNSSAHMQDRCPSIVWIGTRCWPSPLALSSYCIQSHQHFLQDCLFINPTSDKATLWAIETALRSRAVQLVIACCPRVSRSATQRLALAARNNNTTAILLRTIDDLQMPTHALSRWEVAPTPSDSGLPSWSLTLRKLAGLSAHNYSWHLSLNDTLNNAWNNCHESLSSELSFNLLSATHYEAEKTASHNVQPLPSKRSAAGLLV